MPESEIARKVIIPSERLSRHRVDGRSSLFEKFRADYLPLLPFSQAGEMDSLLVGSDQVWNGVITGFDPVYSGATLPDVKKVAWAVSSGSQLLEEEDVKSLSAAFSAISVREPSLQPLFPGSEWLSDPTVLLSEEQWRTMTTPIRERYVLAFPMKNDEEVLRKARQIAQERHLPLKILSQRASLQFDRIQLAGPKEFLSLIASAEYVVTSSYHGAIFSKIFSKEHSWICEPSDPRFQALEKLDFNEAQSRAADFLKRALG